MKQRLTAAILALLLLLPACGTQKTPRERAEEKYLPKIQDALAAVKGSARDTLSDVTFDFDPADAYVGPSAEDREKYGGGKVYEECDSEYFDAICDLVIENLPQDASTYDKYRYLACFLSYCLNYDHSSLSLMDITPYGAITGGNAVCLGYANSFLYLCERAGLWCRVVSGFASWNGEEHGWNLVKLEDGTYYVDVTWCDQYGEPSSKAWSRCFMLTEERLAQDHGIWNGGPATGKTIY